MFYVYNLKSVNHFQRDPIREKEFDCRERNSRGPRSRPYVPGRRSEVQSSRPQGWQQCAAESVLNASCDKQQRCEQPSRSVRRRLVQHRIRQVARFARRAGAIPGHCVGRVPSVSPRARVHHPFIHPSVRPSVVRSVVDRRGTMYRAHHVRDGAIDARCWA